MPRRALLSLAATSRVHSPPGSLRVVPLGGLGEIGMNCMAIEHGDDLVVLDCGVMFPERELGVDVIHPDFRWLLERRDKLRAIVVTHGHEDHIGAVPYLLRQVPVPVYGPRYALELVRHRLGENGGVPPSAELRPLARRQPVTIGPFEIEPFDVTHSTPESTGLILHTPVGVVVHSGDFRIYDGAPDGAGFDRDRLREIGDRGVRLLFSDSTNVDVERQPHGERVVAAALDRLIGAARHRVVVSLFASNVHRLVALFAAARAHGRKICLLGRSMHTHVKVASELGLLENASAILVPNDRARAIPRRQLLVLATGTQGEIAAAMARLAADRHPDLSLEPGDEVIFSSRVIPGRELSVHGMINDLERRGVVVRSRHSDPDVHVSGHAARDEQRALLDLVRPRSFVPVHGTFHHLARHAALAREAGVTDTLVVENGAILELDASSMRVAGRAPTGRIHVDAGEEIPDIVLRDRALLAELGIAIVVVSLDRHGQRVGMPHVLTRGVVSDEAEADVAEEARQYVADELDGYESPRLVPDEEDLRERAQRALKRYFGRRVGRKPLSWAVVVRV